MNLGLVKMERLIIIYGFFIFMLFESNLFPQTKQNLLEQFERNNIRATEIEPNIYKIEYPWGKWESSEGVLSDIPSGTAVYNYNELKPQPYIDALGNILDIDSTYIDLTTIDTSLYSNMFTLWKEVNFAGYPLYYSDENNNGQLEFYGIEGYQDSSKFVIYEKDSSNNFNLKHIYTDSVYRLWGFGGLHDIKNIGQKNYFLMGTKFIGGTGINGCLSYKNDSISKLPTKLDFIMDKYSSFDDLTFGDFDKNNIQDLLFISSPGICIAEYDSISNNIQQVYSVKPGIGNIHGFTTGDFDLDGKTEIVASSIYGYISLIKNIGIHNYKYAWQTRLNTYNIYYHFTTNDIDISGKPEFWVSGFNLENGTYLIKLFAFESMDDTSYKPVRIIIIKPHQNFDFGPCYVKDVDNDGYDEIIVTVEPYILILKYNRTKNIPNYEVFCFKYVSRLVYYSQFINLDSDNYSELFISTSKNSKFISKIYKSNFTTSVESDKLKNNIETNKSLKTFPNPFNNKVKLSFIINNQDVNEDVSINIFNVLGQRIKSITLSNSKLGENIVEWDGTDDFGYPQSSSVYFIYLKTKSGSTFNKTLLIK